MRLMEEVVELALLESMCQLSHCYDRTGPEGQLLPFHEKGHGWLFIPEH